MHVLDRGYANAWTIEWMLHFKQDFLVRWKKNHLLIHAQKGPNRPIYWPVVVKAQRAKATRDKERKLTKHVSVGWTGWFIIPILPIR